MDQGRHLKVKFAGADHLEEVKSRQEFVNQSIEMRFPRQARV